MAAPWQGTILLRRPNPESARRLFRALGPEASREVPRARVRISVPEPTVVRIQIEARDTGGLRAALNTYLGWMALAERTEALAGAERATRES